MNRDELFELLQELPDDLVEEVHHYAEYLSEKVKSQRQRNDDFFWGMISLIKWDVDQSNEQVDPLLAHLSEL
ncbi:MAG: DUF2281 domain-containing protein, partial [Bacteroidota bacterium]